MEARFYKVLANKVKCELCPHNCQIKPDNYGICNVRKNVNGKLIAENYGMVSSMGFDPIEKKPLYHFYPGSEILSIGSVGCNLKCKFCQNWQISQCGLNDYTRETRFYDPSHIVNLAKSRADNIGIAYTYNEPTVFYEFMIETARLAKQKELKNVMVSNGFINKEPLAELLNHIDAFNIDLKAFTEQFYRDYTNSQLEPVKKTLLDIAKSGRHLEITHLVIPGLNDDESEFEKMMQWISSGLGDEVVMHLSRYFPVYQMNGDATPVNKLLQFEKIAKKYVNYVYLGNILLEDGSNTYCPGCNELVISRKGYLTKLKSLNEHGQCAKCGYQILKY